MFFSNNNSEGGVNIFQKGMLDYVKQRLHLAVLHRIFMIQLYHKSRIWSSLFD